MAGVVYVQSFFPHGRPDMCSSASRPGVHGASPRLFFRLIAMRVGLC